MMTITTVEQLRRATVTECGVRMKDLRRMEAEAWDLSAKRALLMKKASAYRWDGRPDRLAKVLAEAARVEAREDELRAEVDRLTKDLMKRAAEIMGASPTDYPL